MRLNCARSSNFSIHSLWKWIGDAAGQTPERVCRREPQIAALLSGKSELLCGKSLPRENWEEVLKEYFFAKLTGPHRSLRKIFSSFSVETPPLFTVGGHLLESFQGMGTDSCVYGTADGFCLKVSPKKEKLKKEYEILRQLEHRNVVRCFDFILEADHGALLLEPLSTQLGSEESYLRALEYCHARGILHGDIRLGNLGTDSAGNGRLFDFGNAAAAGTADEKLLEINTLKNIMYSPMALERKAPAPAGETEKYGILQQKMRAS